MGFQLLRQAHHLGEYAGRDRGPLADHPAQLLDQHRDPLVFDAQPVQDRGEAGVAVGEDTEETEVLAGVVPVQALAEGRGS